MVSPRCSNPVRIPPPHLVPPPSRHVCQMIGQSKWQCSVVVFDPTLTGKDPNLRGGTTGTEESARVAGPYSFPVEVKYVRREIRSLSDQVKSRRPPSVCCSLLGGAGGVIVYPAVAHASLLRVLFIDVIFWSFLLLVGMPVMKSCVFLCYRKNGGFRRRKCVRERRA